MNGELWTVLNVVKVRIRNWLNPLVTPLRDGGGGLTYEAVGEELVDGGESEARDWSGGVLGSHHFQEGPQEHVGLHICQLCRERQREKIKITKRGGERKMKGRLDTEGQLIWQLEWKSLNLHLYSSFSTITTNVSLLTHYDRWQQKVNVHFLC